MSKFWNNFSYSCGMVVLLVLQMANFLWCQSPITLLGLLIVAGLTGKTIYNDFAIIQLRHNLKDQP
jgi:chromate transport protein ChrA